MAPNGPRDARPSRTKGISMTALKPSQAAQFRTKEILQTQISVPSCGFGSSRCASFFFFGRNDPQKLYQKNTCKLYITIYNYNQDPELFTGKFGKFQCLDSIFPVRGPNLFSFSKMLRTFQTSGH